jgi:hypothetical protein
MRTLTERRNNPDRPSLVLRAPDGPSSLGGGTTPPSLLGTASAAESFAIIRSRSLRRSVTLTLTVALLTLTGCSQATWTLTTWGEDYVEQGIPAADFEDGCEVVYDEFLIVLSNPALRNGDGDPVSQLPVSRLFDLSQPGPHEVGSSVVRATTYARANVQVAPLLEQTVVGNATEAQLGRMESLSLVVSGTVTCGADAVEFAWAYDTETMYECQPELTLADGGEGTTEFTVHGDHLFYDGLENPDALLRGQAVVDADANDDGAVSRAELSGVQVAPLGLYDVGSYSDVVTLDDFIELLTQTVGHVDGEGHCQIEL